ncbi:MAG TPA: NAD-dependent succinate-semialdehyde dehydrogenase [Euzebya sp.]|nr:NAD-dependent succinate-semialdehyde dehydrogenase [Euzebya sp.]
MYINGEWCDAISGATFDVTNPATGAMLGSVPDGNAQDATRAVDAAAAVARQWGSTTPHARAELLMAGWRLMTDRTEALAALMTAEQGKPLRAARFEIGYAADFLRWFAEEARRIEGAWLPSTQPGQRFLQTHVPVGVVAAITPWNYPISMLTRKMGPALAAGCPIVLKPAEATPLCARAVIEVFHDAGFPPGAVNLVTASDPAPVGAVLTGDPAVRKVTFTGSTAVGRRLAAAAAGNLKRLSMELGGHAPAIVFPDADPVRSAKGLAALKFLNTGQACISPNRMYVHASVVEDFTDTVVARVAGLRVGDGSRDGVAVGPLIDEAAVAKVAAQVDDARAHGAGVPTGGHRLTEDGLDRGSFYAPTVLTGVTPAMLIHREETFGPVAPIITYDDVDQIIEAANDTEYGLAAYVFTRDLSTALRAVEGLDFAIIGVNDVNPTSASVPFGGMKSSGLGREGGHEGLAEYLETKVAGITL